MGAINQPESHEIPSFSQKSIILIIKTFLTLTDPIRIIWGKKTEQIIPISYGRRFDTFLLVFDIKIVTK